MLVVFFLSCTTPPDRVVVAVGPPHLQGLDLARRASFAVRGIPLQPDEQTALAADPSALSAWVDTWLESEEFLATMRDYHGDWLQIRTDSIPQYPAVWELEALNSGQIFASTTEEPLQLVEHVLRSRLPYTDLVTVDYTFADAVVAAIYGLPWGDRSHEPNWEASWLAVRPHTRW